MAQFKVAKTAERGSYRGMVRYYITANFSPTTRSQPIYIPAYKYLQSLELTMTAGDEKHGVGGAISGSMVLFDRYSELFTDQVFIGGSWAVNINFQWGDAIVGTPYYQNPTFNMMAIRSVPMFTRSGIGATFDLVGAYTVPAYQNIGLGPRNFPAGMLISDMVTAIASWFGWNTTIEPTFGVLKDPFDMGDRSPLEFIFQVLLPRARNKNNEAFDGSRWEATHNMLYFCSKRYLVASLGLVQTYGNAPGLNWKYVYGADYTGDVISFTPTDDSFILGQVGGTDMTHVAVNSYEGSADEYQSTQEGGPTNFDDDSKGGVAGIRTTDEAVVPNMRLNQSASPTDQNYHLAKSRHLTEYLGQITHKHMTARFSQSAEMVTIGSHHVRPNDFISARALDFQGYDMYTGGIYQVMLMTHTLDSSGWKTKYNLARMGLPDPPSVPGRPTSDELITPGDVNASALYDNGQGATLGPPVNLIPQAT